MAYPSTPRDAQNIPIGSVYVPDAGFVPLQGDTVTLDGNSNRSAAVVVSGAVDVTSESEGGNGGAVPASSTLIGASDGTNLQALQVESASHPNLRSAIYNGANELAVDASGNASVKLSASSALIGGVELVDSAGTNKAAIGAGGALKVDNSGVTQPVSVASLPLPSGAATSAKQPALGTAGSASADVLTVQGIASMTALKVDGSGVTQPVSVAEANTATLSSVAASTSSVALLSATPGRKGVSVYNDSTTATLSLAFAATASTSAFTVPIVPGGYYEMPQPIYPGAISGIWSAAVGNARITELT